MLDQVIIKKLQLCSELPSPRGIALRIIELCQSESTSLTEVAAVVSHDAAIAAKLLRLANSPLYARKRKTDNIRQAVSLFGLNGTLALALGFSVVDSTGKQKGALDYNEFWRRSVASAISCSVLAKMFEPAKKEELFLTGLIQDIGMLAIEKIAPSLYGVPGMREMRHMEVVERERSELKADHADIGSWLLKSWNYPDLIASAVANSHHKNQQSLFDRIVSVSSTLADLWWNEDSAAVMSQAAKHAQASLGLSEDALSTIIEQIGERLEEAARMFDIDIEGYIPAHLLMAKAKEFTGLITVSVIQETTALKHKTDELTVQNSILAEQTRRDNLTGLYNRTYLEHMLEIEFQTARQNSFPLTVAFIDLDHFKHVNDTYGHKTGDDVLCVCARVFQENTRDSNILARYGGEEFVAILPGTDIAASQIVCNRILEALRNADIPVAGAGNLRVTASMGIATFNDQEEVHHAYDLLRMADEALLEAKRNGRNRLKVYMPVSHDLRYVK